jgi:hypothetical protein
VLVAELLMAVVLVAVLLLAVLLGGMVDRWAMTGHSHILLEGDSQRGPTYSQPAATAAVTQA